MFVWTHRHKESPHYQVVVTGKFEGTYFYITPNKGYTKHSTDIYFESKYKPITFPCPSCKTELQQSERVECGECGIVLKAVDEETTNTIFPGASENIKVYKGQPYRVIRGIYMFYINGIHWLQTQDGKKS